MKLTMGESKFGVPNGSYRARFIGVKEREPMPGSDYGPGLEWSFEVIDGPQAGRVTSRTTGTQPSTKNSCGRMLNGLAGGAVPAKGEVDLEQFVGRAYLIMVGPNQAGTGTRVETVMPVDVVTPAPAPTPPPAAPRPQRPAQAPRKVHVALSDDGDPQVFPGLAEAAHAILASGLHPDDVQVFVEGEAAWKSASEAGVKLPF